MVAGGIRRAEPPVVIDEAPPAERCFIRRGLPWLVECN